MMEISESDVIDLEPANMFSGFRWLRKVSWLAFGVQFLCLASFKFFMYKRFSGTLDENEYQQGLYLISRGHLDPVSTAWHGRALITDHGSIFVWLFAPLYWLPPEGVYFLLFAIVAVVAAEVIAFEWILRIVMKSIESFRSHWEPLLICSLGLLVLVANPWTLWAIADDVHGELFAAPFIIAAAFNFSRKRYKWAWACVALTLSVGAIASTWIVGLALSALLASCLDRESRRKVLSIAVLLFLLGFGSLEAFSQLGLDAGSSLRVLFGYLTVPVGRPVPQHVTPTDLLKAAITHPRRFGKVYLNHLQDIFANLAPTGILGVATTWTIGVPLSIILTNNLCSRFRYAGPGFQSIPIYTFSAVGLVIVFVWFTSKFKSGFVIILAAMLIAINAIAWSVLYVPNVKQTWVSVSKSQAAILWEVLSRIPSDAEVVASQGIISNFSYRSYVYSFNSYLYGSNFYIPVKARQIWCVVTPTAGIEFSSVQSDELLAELSSLRYSKLVVAKDGVFAFKIDPPLRKKRIYLRHFRSAPAWSLSSPEGVKVERGKVSSWHVQSLGPKGYISEGDYWNVPKGNFTATIRISNSSPVNIEVWNDTGNVLLSREDLSTDSSTHIITDKFTVSRIYPLPVAYSGVGIFKTKWPFGANSNENEVEVRVWNSGGGPDNVYSIELQGN